ncbi:MAG: sugar ABC transporter permease [Armatimonadetes bacterium]|nr:sugar ABC transporter permease [Armatimonadota bacterium]
MKFLLSKFASNEAAASYVFLLPNFLGFLVFTSMPVLASLTLSFVDWDLLSPPKYVGFQNFVNLLWFHKAEGSLVANDPLFWKYFYNTVVLMLVIPFSMAGSLLVALAMNQKLRGITVFRTVYFLPTVCSGVALCLLWRWIFNSDFGILNSFLTRTFDLLRLDISPPGWLTDIRYAKPALMLMNFWGAIGGVNMLLYLAALQGVPRELYEAAEMDGANGWQRFRSVTLPFISPTTFFIFIMSVIGGFQGGFMQAFIMTGGGPAGATTTLEYYIYNNAYQWLKMGYAAAIAWFLFLIVFVVTLINWRFGGKLVHY